MTKKQKPLRYYVRVSDYDANSFNIYDREDPEPDNPAGHACLRTDLTRSEATHEADMLNYGECETCIGTGQVLDGDDGRHRKCLDCNGTGIAYPH